MRLMVKMERPYSRVFAQVGENPEAYLVRFLHDGIADLLNISQNDEADGAVDVAGKQSADCLPDCKIRKVMQRYNVKEKNRYPDIFKTKIHEGRPKIYPPYWPVALATDDQGRRYLSDENLDFLFPKWRSILTRNVVGNQARFWYNLRPEFNEWVAREKSKLKKIGIEHWPSPYFRKDGEMGNPGSPSQVW